MYKIKTRLLIKLFKITVKKTTKGFTLIELLVVIAIIGILSSIVLASLNTARAKGADVAIKSNMANIRAQAEINYDAQQCYGDGTAACAAAAIAVTTCTAAAGTLFANANINSQLIAAGNAYNGGGLSAATQCAYAANGAAWAAATTLKSNSATSWCVDSTGASKLEAFNAAGAITGSACK
jgi:type IV pilus assembly protein PilA